VNLELELNAITATRLVLDDADLKAPQNQQNMLHLINWTKQQSIPLCLMAKSSPLSWQVELPDLKSRLLVMEAISITEPDQDLLKGLLAKLLADCSATSSPLVIEWLAKRMTRSYQACIRLVARLDALALKDKSAITLAHAKQALADEN